MAYPREHADGMRAMTIFALAQAKIGVKHEDLLGLAKTMGST